MSYRSESIARSVSRMNVRYFLPAIQREFVWKPNQIIELFDSIMRKYPISSVLFWELRRENRHKWQVYKFIENAKQGGTHNELASTAGVDVLTMVLDGQQRLTSLMIGLKGSYAVKRKYSRWDSLDAWSKQTLHLDLLGDPADDSQTDERGVYYRFEFFEKAPPNDDEHFWFPVSTILDFDTRQSFDDYIDTCDLDLRSKGFARTDLRLFERNLKRLYEIIHEDEVIAYYTESDQDYDRVLDIFVRANEGGTKLSKSDLLLSMVTSKWDGVNAREQIFGFVDSINSQLTKPNDFDKDFVMKSCLVLSDLPVVYKVQNFNNDNLELIRRNWESIKSAIWRGVDLINSFGIDRNNLTSVNAIIPVMYYLLKHPGLTLRGSTTFEVANSATIRAWLIMVLLRGAFGRASDGLLTSIRAAMQSQESTFDFPFDAISDVIVATGLSAGFDDRAIEDVLRKSYGGKQTFLALSLLYDDVSWGTIPHDQDHIFPTNHFKPRELAPDRLSWIPAKDHLGNLCLLMASENRGKQDMSPFDWLSSRDPTFLTRHLIPQDSSLWHFEKFPQFLAAREQLIKLRLKRLFAQV
jgi:uncharacterized protein with ParB-like and HNH nuclease domain